MASTGRDDLTSIEMLVLWEAGGDNTIHHAYAVVEKHGVDQREVLSVTEEALLRLFDLRLVRFVEAPEDVGYTAERFELPVMTREELLAVFEEDPPSLTGTQIWYDPTTEGQAMLDSLPPRA